MAQSLSSVLIHLVFSTKNREPFINPAIENDLYRYMAKIFRELKSPSLSINGTSDHVHSLFSLSRVISIADLVEEIKTSTSKMDQNKWTRVQKLLLAERLWRIFHRPIKCRNIEALHPRPKKHHQHHTFQDEYRKFLKAYQIPYDELYVWD